MSARISDLTELIDRAKSAERPGIAKVSSKKRDSWKRVAKARFATTVLGGNEESQRALAEVTLEVDESALRRPETSLPMPWWLEALIEREPELAAAYVRSILEDIERLRPTGT